VITEWINKTNLITFSTSFSSFLLSNGMKITDIEIHYKYSINFVTFSSEHEL